MIDFTIISFLLNPQVLYKNSSARIFFLELNYCLYYNNLVLETGETVFRRTSIIHGGFKL